VGFTVAFVWLNIDFWIGGLPLTWIGSQPEIRFLGQARRGFPFSYDGMLPFPEWQWSALAIDVVIGLIAWLGLYCTRSAAQRIQSRPT
jgi:di/tricarboxylate transporter